MIQIQGKICRQIYVACSGGVDSMAVVDFLRRSHNVTLLFFDHGTDASADALEFLKDYVLHRPSLNLEIGTIDRDRRSRESLEEYWRVCRYDWFHTFDAPVITCHHLDDCVETWVWSSLHGNGKIIPYANRNVVRPFRLNRKAELINWCRRHDVAWVDDASNEDTKHVRNYIRRELISKCLVVNPGLHNVVRKKVLEDGPR